MVTSIIGLITLVLTIAWGIFQFRTSAKRQKEAVWNEFRNLEKQYRAALAAGDPVLTANIDKRMRELRAKYLYLNRD